MLVVWKLDRLGRNLAHLVNTVQDLSARGVGLRVLAEPVVAVNDPVDGLTLRLEHVVEAGFDQLAVAVEELAVHVDGLVERVAPRLVQETHQREVTAWGRHPAYPVGRGGSHAVKQDPLVVAVDPAHVDSQHAGRLDQFQPRQQPLHAPDGRVRRARLDPVQRRVRLVVVDGDQRIKTVAHRCPQALGHALRQQRALRAGRLCMNISRPWLPTAAVRPPGRPSTRMLGLDSPWQKSALHSTGAASRLTSLFLGRILPVCSLVTPCQPGASPVSVRRGTFTTGC